MADKAVVTQTTLDAIGQAIIAKGGATAAMTPAQMPGAIQSIPSGGEWVIQPWIMDTTDPTKLDGWIHLWFHTDYDTKSYAYFNAQYISNGHTFSVDWGDGTVETIAASTTYTTRTLTHAYAEKGDYRVDITGYDSVKFNQYMFGNNYSYSSAWLCIRQIQLGSFDAENGISVRTDAIGIRAVNWVGQMSEIGESAFIGCYSLVSVGDLSACTSIGADAFSHTALSGDFTFPSLVKLIGAASSNSGTFYNTDIISLTMPELTACGNFTLIRMHQLKTLYAPKVEILNNAFAGYNEKLETIVATSASTFSSWGFQMNSDRKLRDCYLGLIASDSGNRAFENVGLDNVADADGIKCNVYVKNTVSSYLSFGRSFMPTNLTVKCWCSDGYFINGENTKHDYTSVSDLPARGRPEYTYTLSDSTQWQWDDVAHAYVQV